MAIKRELTSKYTATLLQWFISTCMFSTLSVATASEPATARSVTLHEPHGVSHHVYDNNTNKRQPLSENRTTKHASSVLWLYDISISLQQDYDNDGFYSNFSISFDFDTYLSSANVYAVLYVSKDNGPLVEYAVTGIFSVQGAIAGDAYTIHTTLDSGYQTGYYDHYIEIYDAYSHELLAGYGPQDSHTLHGLPIESTPHDYHRGIATSLSLNFSGTGSFAPSAFGLLAVPLLAALRRRKAQAKPQQALPSSQDRH